VILLVKIGFKRQFIESLNEINNRKSTLHMKNIKLSIDSLSKSNDHKIKTEVSSKKSKVLIQKE